MVVTVPVVERPYRRRMYARVFGVTILGVGGHLVSVEAFVGRGLPSLIVTGLPGATLRDGRDRIRPAVEHAGFQWPLRRVVVNLAPGNVRKEGPGLDLAVAVAVLAATAQIPSRSLPGVAVFGELSLKGEVLPTPGVISVAMAAARRGLSTVIVPATDAAEAAQVEGLNVVAAGTLADVVGFLRGTWDPPLVDIVHETPEGHDVDLADVRGQVHARRALEVAAAGGHNLLMVGSPGAGKTMLARRLPTILPALDRDEALEATQLHSVAGLRHGRGLLAARPFRAPHHSISTAGLLGSGAAVFRPGEVSLAHRGVLFLDELTEFRRDAIESLRQPLEDGRVVVARAGGSVTFPARFTLVAAANPCPCGFEGDPVKGCRCRHDQASRYRRSCQARCSTGSISVSRCRASRKTSSLAPPTPRRRRRCEHEWKPQGVGSVGGTPSSAWCATPIFPARWLVGSPGSGPTPSACWPMRSSGSRSPAVGSTVW